MRRKPIHADLKKLAKDLTNLHHLDQKNLKEHFRILYDVDPPARMRRPLLIQAIAYQLQAKALGGLRPSTRRRLESAAENASAHRPLRLAYHRKFKPGTTLLREWHGVHHRVTVLPDGIRWRTLSLAIRSRAQDHG